MKKIIFSIMLCAGLHATAAVCNCGVAPERQNDFYFENDVFGMRVYGPGEDHRWSGLDVFNKLNDAISVGEILHNPNKHGNWHLVPSGGVLDNYAMGAGRGLGGVALFGDGEWKTYPDWERCEIIQASGDVCEFKLVYPAFSLAGKMTYHITLRKGENFFRNEVSFEREFGSAVIGPGFDISPKRNHGGDLYECAEKGIISLYEDSRGEVEGSTMLALVLDPKDAGLEFTTDHLGCRVLPVNKKKFVYYAGACWSRRGEVTSAQKWHQLVRDFQKGLSK